MSSARRNFAEALRALRNRINAINRWGHLNDNAIEHYVAMAVHARRGSYRNNRAFGGPSRTVRSIALERRQNLSGQDEQFLALLRQAGASSNKIMNARRRLRQGRIAHRNTPSPPQKRKRSPPPPPNSGARKASGPSYPRSGSRGSRMVKSLKSH